MPLDTLAWCTITSSARFGTGQAMLKTSYCSPRARLTRHALPSDREDGHVKIELVPVSEPDRPVLRRLLERYRYNLQARNNLPRTVR